MKDTLKPGLVHQFKFKVPSTKMVPHLYPESAAFREMPEVLATGYLVGLLEWACIDAIKSSPRLAARAIARHPYRRVSSGGYAGGPHPDGRCPPPPGRGAQAPIHAFRTRRHGQDYRRQTRAGCDRRGPVSRKSGGQGTIGVA